MFLFEAWYIGLLLIRLNIRFGLQYPVEISVHLTFLLMLIVDFMYVSNIKFQLLVIVLVAFIIVSECYLMIRAAKPLASVRNFWVAIIFLAIATVCSYVCVCVCVMSPPRRLILRPLHC